MDTHYWCSHDCAKEAEAERKCGILHGCVCVCLYVCGMFVCCIVLPIKVDEEKNLWSVNEEGRLGEGKGLIYEQNALRLCCVLYYPCRFKEMPFGVDLSEWFGRSLRMCAHPRH